MKKIFTRRNVLFLLFFLTIAVFFLIYTKYFPQENPIQTTIYPTISENDKWISYKTLLPGKSSREDVDKLLGEPIKTDQKGGNNILEYRGTNSNWNNEVTVKEGVVVFIKRIVSTSDKIKASEITKTFGEPNLTLYGPHAEAGFLLNVYLEKGLAYLGNKDKEIILEIWYFPPGLTINDFIDQYAQDYQKEPGTKTQFIDKAPDNN